MNYKDIMDKEFKNIQVHFNAQELFKIFKLIELQAEKAGHDDILNIALATECMIRDQVRDQYETRIGVKK